MVITIAVMILSPMIYGVNSIVLGLLVGILLGNILKLSQQTSMNLGLLSTYTLEIAILFIAFSIDYGQLLAHGLRSLLIIIIMIIGIIAIGALLGRLSRSDQSSSLLISFGTAICGSSAIAALAPSVSNDKEEIGISIAVVNLLGTLGMLALPFL